MVIFMKNLNPYCYNISNVRVIDGDTIEADVDLGFGVALKKQNIRLWGIDCPPIRTRDGEVQKLGYEAKEALEQYAYLDEIEDGLVVVNTIESRGRCKYGRILATVFSSGKDICAMMLKNGHAVPYEGGKKTHVWVKEGS
jgi:micrococcal nuclease